MAECAATTGSTQPGCAARGENGGWLDTGLHFSVGFGLLREPHD
jgi:hypothetical protein